MIHQRLTNTTRRPHGFGKEPHCLGFPRTSKPEGTTIDTRWYTIGGLPVSTPADALSAANALSDSYLSTLAHFTSLRGIDAHAASLIILICLRPHSRFNHHLRGMPHLLFTTTSDAHPVPLARRLRDAAIRAFAAAAQLDYDATLKAYEPRFGARYARLPCYEQNGCT